MTTTRLIARYFGSTTWDRLAAVLRFTAARHCPDWTLDIVRTAPDDRVSPLGQRLFVVNAQKLDAWAEAVAAAADGEQLLLIDADVMILRPLADVWDQPFDLAYTVKPQPYRHPLNAGVMFLRVSPATRAFVAAWRAENERMFHDGQYHAVWRPEYGGLNQSALGALFHSDAIKGLAIRRLPCLEWNCEDEHWERFDPDLTRIVHLKGALHRALFGGKYVEKYMRPLMQQWLELEDQALAASPEHKEIEHRPKSDRDEQVPAGKPNAPDPPAVLERIVDPTTLTDRMIRSDDLVNREDPAAPPAQPPRPLTEDERRAARRRRPRKGGGPEAAAAR